MGRLCTTRITERLGCFLETLVYYYDILINEYMEVPCRYTEYFILKATPEGILGRCNRLIRPLYYIITILHKIL